MSVISLVLIFAIIAVASAEYLRTVDMKVEITAFNNASLGCATNYGTCNSNGVTGNCVSRSSGCCSGSFNSGNLCPGSDDIQCCYYAKCNTSHGSGTCMQTALCKTQGGTPDSGNYCDGPADIQCCVKGTTGLITRDEILARAQDWVNRRIPYSQTAYTDGYRQDCSGMVSMAWRSSTAGGGHTTYNMQDICTRIDRSQLQKGDAILLPSDHVLMFDHWVDSDHFMEYAEHDYGQVASHDQTSYSYYANQGFFPCRYKSVA